MKRRSFLRNGVLATSGLASLPNVPLAAPAGVDSPGDAPAALDAALAGDWLARWEKNITDDARTRYCDRESGEEIGWLISPFLDGFSNPANKQNHIARWLLAMFDVTHKPVYHERAEKWFRLMKSRMKTRQGGKEFVWNYWDPAGPWDFKPEGSPRHWIGVHPNGGYYAIDVEGVVAAFEHGMVFTNQDIQRLVATNRDFMWNQQIKGARFRRIDGGEPDPRWKNSPGVLWTALVPYDRRLREVFLHNHDPAGWGGLAVTPWFLAREAAGSPAKL